MSEIDDIFASKGKEALVQPITSSSSLSKKKKKKKKLPPMTTPDPIQPESSKKRRLPDTIVDTSHELPTLPKRRKKEKFGSLESNSKNIATFTDSRSNTGRKITEEGWRVYKEDELGINNRGGGKRLSVASPLIFSPFDTYQQTRNCVHSIVIAVSELNRLSCCKINLRYVFGPSGFFEASQFAFHDS